MFRQADKNRAAGRETPAKTRGGAPLKSRIAAALGVLSVLTMPTVVSAEEPGEAKPAWSIGGVDVVGRDNHFFQIGLGAGNVPITDRDRSGFYDAVSAPEGRLEFRLGDKVAGIGPLAGAMANTDGSAFGYAGLYTDLRVGRIYFTPAAGIGAYDEGDGRDLGGTFQFHLALDVAWRLEDGDRIGVKVAHISNAGLHEDNPGTDSVLFTWTTPLGGF